MKIIEVVEGITSWPWYDAACRSRNLVPGLNKGGKKVTWKDDTVTVYQLDRWEEYEAFLQVHDWTYQMSDDKRSYAKGRDEARYLDWLGEELAKVDQERQQRLYSQYKVNF